MALRGPALAQGRAPSFLQGWTKSCLSWFQAKSLGDLSSSSSTFYLLLQAHSSSPGSSSQALDPCETRHRLDPGPHGLVANSRALKDTQVALGQSSLETSSSGYKACSGPRFFSAVCATDRRGQI